jgi:putative chitinase
MCIRESVGRNGRNNPTDVKIIQFLLNGNCAFLQEHRIVLIPDGRIGPNTINAITEYEIRIMGLTQSDSLILPGDTTIASLLSGMSLGFSTDKLNIIMPNATPNHIRIFYPPLVASMDKVYLSSLRMAHFLAQIGHESSSLRYTEEVASGSAYEGRRDLGNTEPGDGRRFKGRGLIQLTGRANYAAYSEDTGIDYIASPELIANNPDAAIGVAYWFWDKHRLSPLADKDNIKTITKRINGGYNGLDDRINYLNRAKTIFGII